MNRGAKELREKLSERGSQAALARELGVDEARMSRWLSGALLPPPKHRARIEDLQGVSWRAWDEPEEGVEEASGDAA